LCVDLFVLMSSTVFRLHLLGGDVYCFGASIVY
jgi:hypothetical protein